MFWTPARSEYLTIMDAAKLTRFSWWGLMAEPEEMKLLLGRPFPGYRLRMRITFHCSHNKISIVHETA